MLTNPLYDHAESIYQLNRAAAMLEHDGDREGRTIKMDDQYYTTLEPQTTESRLIVRSLIGPDDYECLIRDLPDQFFKLSEGQQDWLMRQLVHKLSRNIYWDWSGDLPGLVELASKNGKG